LGWPLMILQGLDWIFGFIDCAMVRATCRA
jgi:hypothetical protein